MEKLLTLRQTAEILNVSTRTLLRWIENGKIRAVRLPSGRIRIPQTEIERILRGAKEARRAAIYARVSGADQREDLERQIEKLREYCRAKGYEVVAELKDVGSGLKADRKGLQKLFRLVAEKKIDVVAITYKDRLTRFGYQYLEWWFMENGMRIEVALGEEPKDAYQELMEDLIAIITSFAGRLYGIRSRKKKNFIEEFRALLNKYGAGR